ncbi:hypothetical protein BD324DRAFT_625039 [Kockovaella imperatae]|uniref:DNA repair protein RAD50 n=1 Tax=Kockovaella imperatae TaxID=4999 RepID=A0A1Y1UI56_9TREE|nr:hypothetical protein BD324DRAFT_625039 [Kockovaella imperatae]ORX37164.1 hypothetical protein BD324DRAFT_625039 [Kockovaella imperatae]
MASLNKLAIRGIRSFDDKHVQVIEFYSPLTVIVGHNGSGKTTIIECLNYVTTGLLPSGSKTGGAFVHDPKMANEKEVKAQVRLRFWNLNRQRMTATRNLQVTTKKTGGLTFKTLEGILAKSDEGDAAGKRNTISTKCSEMDEEVPLLLGVSKAILENVIFCHQEESNWPLSEPAALKKKFDDIFEATKYTKALDNIKALRKERTVELKVDKERLKFFKADKEKAEKLRKQLDDEVRKETAKQIEVDELKQGVDRYKILNVEHYATAASFQSTFERVENLRARKTMLENNRKHILEGMTEMTEETDELEHMLENFATHLKSIEGKKAMQVEMRDKEEAALEDLRKRERGLASAQGGLVANKNIYERNVKERESAIRQAAKTHDFAGYDYSPLEESKVVEFVDKLHELVRRAESDLKKLQAQGARRERDLQAELDRLAGLKTSAIATKKSKQEQIAQLTEKVRQSEASFESVSSLDVEIALLESKIAEAEEHRSKLEKEIRDARFDEAIREKTMIVRQKEAERDKVNAELSVLNRQADSRAQLAIKRNERVSKENQVAASVASHSARFEELIGAKLEPGTMEEKITIALGKRDREVQEAESSSAASNRNLSTLQTSLNIAKRSLKEKREEYDRIEKEVRSGLEETGKETIELAIEEAENEIKILQIEMNDKSTTAAFWEQILAKAQSDHKCMACDRAIAESQAKAVENYMNRRVAGSKRVNVDELKEDEKNWMEELQNRRNLQTLNKTMVELRDKTMPPLEKQVEEETIQLDKVQNEVEDAKMGVQKAKLAVRDLQTLKSAATLVSRTLGEITDLAADVARLERDLEGSGSLKTVEEVQHEVDLLSAEIKNVSRDQQALVSEKDLKSNSVRSASDDIGQKRLRLGTLKSQQEKRMRDEAALTELQETLSQLQNQLKTLDSSAQSAEAPWREKMEELNRYRTERQNAENDQSLQVGIYQSSLNDLESKHRACQAYLTEGNDRKIRENEAQMEDLKREIGLTTEARAKIDSAIASLQDELSRANSLRTNISANVRYRNEQKDILKVQEELDGMDVEEAAKARKDFNKRFSQMMQREQEITNDWQRASGVLSQVIENRKRMQETLESEYKNIDKMFKEQLIKTKVSEVANNDLEKYGKALDNAILKYHSIKMDEINDNIGHLWNKTYQGTDIDGIKIVSDHDETTSTSTRKSYNYRVVMIKDSVELDMRGRCSAGQKVLASIIIRLALAESFGQGCGVLALDEPTTNLDQENINALAESLAEIIRERRRQANFQLIVITHDEGFLQRLAAHDVLEYYWRVHRDASQKSALERQRVGL